MARKNKRIVFEGVEIIDAGAKGKGIAKAPDGRIIFVDDVIPGDVADLQTYKKRKAYYHAKPIRFHQYSNKRIPLEEQNKDYSGVAPWQNMQYEHQLLYKQKEVENNLRRLGNLELPEISPIIGSKATHYYRNKMEYTFSNKRWFTEEEINSTQNFDHLNQNALGFHVPGMWDKVINIKECHLQKEPSNAIRNAIREFALKNDLSFLI